MGFVGDNKVKIGGTEKAFVFVIRDKRLNCGNDNFSGIPLFAFLLIDYGSEIISKNAKSGIPLKLTLRVFAYRLR